LHEAFALGHQSFEQMEASPSVKHMGSFKTNEQVIQSVADEHDCRIEARQTFRSKTDEREIAALLYRELTNISLADISFV